MNTSDELKALDDRIKECKKTVALGQSLERLLNNRDFKAVILEGYFREEAIRLVSAKGDPNLQSPEIQASIIRQIDAIGSVQDFLRLISSQADQAIKMIEDAEALREEILAEENE